MQVQFDDLVTIASELGIGIMSALDREESDQVLAEASKKLSHWQAQKFSASMTFMNRDSSLYRSLDSVLSCAKSSVLIAVPYSSPMIPAPPEEKGYGSVARYAWGEDYHIVLKDLLDSFVARVSSSHGFENLSYKCFADSVPILERALSDAADLGFIGKSSMLIRPGVGTYFFLCEVLWNVEVTHVSSQSILKSSCGTCSRCREQCPTGAIVQDKVVDSRKCISYLTIEHRELLSLKEMGMLDSWIFGCDVCQEVCPFNHEGTEAIGIKENFSEHFIAGPRLKISEILRLRSTKKFNTIFEKSPLLRTRRSGLLRNALSIAFNHELFQELPAIIECAEEDASELVREQAKLVLESFLEIADGSDKTQIKNALESRQRGH